MAPLYPVPLVSGALLLHLLLSALSHNPKHCYQLNVGVYKRYQYSKHMLTRTSGITAERDIGSSQDFGDRVQSLFERRSLQSTENRPPSTKSPRAALFPEKRPPISLRKVFVNDENSPVLPSEEQAFELLEAIMLYFYEPQHLFDARDVSDRISGLCENEQEQLQTPNIWTLQTCLVFAVGRLLRGESDVAGKPPGSSFFNFVERNLPSPSELRRQGLAGIEVLVLMVIYLQNIDQKDDASIYVRRFVTFVDSY
jgi:proline utilization trans-activator